MKTLYLDTAYNQVIGICDERGQWLQLSVCAGQRSSATLHQVLHELCKASGITPAEITSVVYLAGPGFYTGLRIAYGIAQTMKLQNIQTRSLYAYDVPALLGKSSYTWVTKAYRGEVFVYRSTGTSSALMSEADFLEAEWAGDMYVHQNHALDEKLLAKLPTAISTQELITQNFPLLLAHVLASPEAPLHYFRAPEDEFRPSPA